MPASATSARAYNDHVRSGAASSQRERIETYIRLFYAANGRGISRQEIADTLQIPLASVCGRVAVLLEDGRPKGRHPPRLKVAGARQEMPTGARRELLIPFDDELIQGILL